MMAERDNAGVIAPPPVIALIALVLGLAFDRIWPIPFLPSQLVDLPTRLVLGGLLIAVGIGLAIFAEHTFRRIGTNALPWQPALRLAATGIYAHSAIRCISASVCSCSVSGSHLDQSERW